MENICIVCGKSFKPKLWNQQTCSDECKNKRQYQFWLDYKKEHEDKKEDKKEKQKQKLKRKTVTKSVVKVLATDAKWIKDYAKGDRLTQISMLARALNDLNIARLSYGQLATFWDTKKYYAWEKNVISQKRKEQAYANKNTFKDIYQVAAEDISSEKERT